MDKMKEKIEEFRAEKEAHEFNVRELTRILIKLQNNEEILEVEKNYLQIFFD